jgi:hypothetical protein
VARLIASSLRSASNSIAVGEGVGHSRPDSAQTISASSLMPSRAMSKEELAYIGRVWVAGLIVSIIPVSTLFISTTVRIAAILAVSSLCVRHV